MYTPRRLESELEVGSLSSASLNRLSLEEEEEDRLSPGSSILAARAFFANHAINCICLPVTKKVSSYLCECSWQLLMLGDELLHCADHLLAELLWTDPGARVDGGPDVGLQLHWEEAVHGDNWHLGALVQGLPHTLEKYSVKETSENYFLTSSHTHSSGQGERVLPDVFCENWDYGLVGFDRHPGEPRPLAPQHRVVAVTEQGLKCSARGDAEVFS